MIQKLIPSDVMRQHFTRYMPRRLENLVYERGAKNDLLSKQADCLDVLEFFYRRYLIGAQGFKTLHRVIYEVRRAHEYGVDITPVFEEIEGIMLHFELYELLAKNKIARAKVEAVIDSLNKKNANG